MSPATEASCASPDGDQLGSSALDISPNFIESKAFCMIAAQVTPSRFDNVAAALMRAGALVSRYGLVVVLAWIGFGKYVKMEARVLIEHSPLMSWMYDYLSVTTVARGLGTMEIVAAILIALRPVSPRASTVGSALAIVLFMGTLSFLFTTPGVVATHAAGLPVLTAQPGQFLLKDLVLMGVSIWTLGDSLSGAVRSRVVNQPD
jgi:uncharacterized membrane protein YkgB